MSLPSDLTTADVHALVIALLYPSRVPSPLDEQLKQDGTIKLAVVFEQDDKEYRVLRRGKPSSLRLQRKGEGGYTGLAKGEDATVEALAGELGLPDFESFAALNLWRFDDDELYDPANGAAALDERGRELVEKYRTAVRVETLEDRIKNIEGKIAEQRKQLGTGAKIEEKLEQAKAKLEQLRLDDLSEEDLSLLSEKDERFEEFDHQLDRLIRQEEDERIDVERKLPDRPWKVPLFWAGLAIGVAALGVSVGMHDTLRQAAAVNVVGFGMVAWVLLKYFTDLERASVHQVRLESIKRRLNQVREEEVSFREQINHLLIHAGVENEEELFVRVEKTSKLEQIIEQLEAKATEARRDPTYKAAAATIAELEEELEDLEAERTLLPEFVMSTFQLENDLQSLGIEPADALSDDEDDEPEEVPQTAFGRLKLAAERTGQWTASGLQSRTRKMWGKICGHVLGNRFKGVELSPEGDLRVRDLSDDKLEMWRRTRSSEERIVKAALALALHVNTADRSGGYFETIWVNDPRDDFGSNVSDAFDEVFESAAKKSHIVLCSG
ncbi:hypothetical protein FIV42_04265 [Persicimonas caeni]|uniref:Uncharacterized protein n=1 Tax=Persicimonas caeni TaxID=2292766 RepID=A0A4Y6PNT5_PERCE|nr:hypothetical protein [Persicimonas caeni]QDG49981.1 hypothetical protein FIV42_04265 [Persicimonas caeni]QED31202.1 hypothetical protein FRD00_04260 [Persicimonas caeni]